MLNLVYHSLSLFDGCFGASHDEALCACGMHVIEEWKMKTDRIWTTSSIAIERIEPIQPIQNMVDQKCRANWGVTWHSQRPLPIMWYICQCTFWITANIATILAWSPTAENMTQHSSRSAGKGILYKTKTITKLAICLFQANW